MVEPLGLFDGRDDLMLPNGLNMGVFRTSCETRSFAVIGTFPRGALCQECHPGLLVLLLRRLLAARGKVRGFL